MYFTREEKLVVLHALNQVLIADGEVTQNEKAIMKTYLSNFGCSVSDLVEARDMDATRIVSVVKSMSREQKEFFKGSVANMALSEGADQDLDNRVQRAVNVYFALAK